MREVTVRVPGEGGLVIEEVLCYPNPMSSSTTFVYQLSRPAAVRIRVYTLSGRLVDEIAWEGRQGYNQTPWDGGELLAGGLYLFSIAARTQDGVQAERVERLAVVRLGVCCRGKGIAAGSRGPGEDEEPE